MSDSENVDAGERTSPSPKKIAKSKTTSSTKNQQGAGSSRPKTSVMVNAAIKNLKERGGSSLQAIKKYIVMNYDVDAEKVAPFIRKYLKSAVTSGVLVQTKGKGASGSFKLAPSTSAEKKVSQKKAATESDSEKKTEKRKKKKIEEKVAPVKKKIVKKASSTPIKKTLSAPMKKAKVKVKASAAKPKSNAKPAESQNKTTKPKSPKPKKAAPKAKPAKKAAAAASNN